MKKDGDKLIFSNNNNNVEHDETNNQGNEDYSKRNNSERVELKFWNEMKNIHPRNERMHIYNEKIRNGLIYRGDIPTSDNNNANIIIQKNKEPIIYPDKKNIKNTIKNTIKNSIKNDPSKNNKKKKLALKWKILIAFLALGIIAAVIVLCLLFLIEKEKKSEKENYITGLTYKENQVMRFQNVKKTKIDFDFGEISVDDTSRTLIEYSDYVIGISKRGNEKEGQVEREIFEGYIFLENYILDNETNKMLLQNNSLFQDVWQKYYFRNLQGIDEQKYVNFALDEIEPYGCIDKGTPPIMKFIFYRNGIIKRIYKPKNLATILYNNMIELLEKVIPKIVDEYFNKTYNNIEEALESEYEKLNNNLENNADQGHRVRLIENINKESDKDDKDKRVNKLN